MADELKQAWTPTDEQLESAQTFGKVAAATSAGLYGIRGLARSLMEGVLDTQGYGVHSPIAKYKNTGKVSQALNNALQAGRGSASGAMREITHSIFTGVPLELKAMQKSIQDVEKNMSMIKSTLVQENIPPSMRKILNEELNLLSIELKDREKGLMKRTGLTTNVKLGLRRDVSNINLGSNFKVGQYVVDDNIVAIEKGMANYKGKTIPALIHQGKQIEDFKGIAARDPRVQYMKKLMREGRIKTAKKAAYESRYLWGKDKKLVIPKIGPEGLPVNYKGETLGRQKFTRLTGDNRIMHNGRLIKTYRVGFVPRIPQGMTPKLEYITGRHWQYMDYGEISKGQYVPLRGGMRDVHDLGTSSKFKRAERILSKPVINVADWELQSRSPIGTKYNVKNPNIQIGRMRAASRLKVYGQKTGEMISAARKGRYEPLSGILKLAIKIGSRGRIKI